MIEGWVERSEAQHHSITFCKLARIRAATILLAFLLPHPLCDPHDAISGSVTKDNWFWITWYLIILRVRLGGIQTIHPHGYTEGIHDLYIQLIFRNARVR